MLDLLKHGPEIVIWKASMTRIDEISGIVIVRRPVDEILLWRCRGMSDLDR